VVEHNANVQVAEEELFGDVWKVSDRNQVSRVYVSVSIITDLGVDREYEKRFARTKHVPCRIA
jgi:hypothetical protein